MSAPRPPFPKAFMTRDGLPIEEFERAVAWRESVAIMVGIFLVGLIVGAALVEGFL